MFARLLAAALAIAIFVSPTNAYIHFPPATLAKLCKISTNVRELTVKKFDRDKGIVVYELTDTLKGETKTEKSIRHNIGKKTDGSKPIYDWLA